MIAASWPRDDRRSTRMLHVDPRHGTFTDRTIGDLRELLRNGDLLVVNDAATLPASLSGADSLGAPIEARLAGELNDGTWRAVLFGAGDWRTRTEDRPRPPRMNVGERLSFDGLHAQITAIDERSPRWVELAFDQSDTALWNALYRSGRPVQYSYAARPFELWNVQTAFAARPWAVEPPSAGFALTWDLLLDLRRRGIGVARVTHAAGLSSTGDDELDARLPLDERFEIPEATSRAIEATRERNGRIVAIGTTVTRALESATTDSRGRVVADRATTSLRLSADTQLRVVDAILTGVHEPDSSHFALLETFAPRDLLERAHAFAEARSYRGHEFGDTVLVLSNSEVADRS